MAASELTARFVTALRASDREAVREAAAAMLDARLPLGQQWRAVAQAMLKDGEFALARRAAALLAAQVGSPLARFEALTIEAQAGRPERAAEVLRDMPGDVPDPLANAYTRGTLALNLGRTEEAREHLRRAVDLAPLSGQAWLALASAGGLDDAYGALLAEQEAGFAEVQGEDRACYLKALGRWHERLGDRAGAAAAYTASGEVMASLRPYDFSADKAEAEAIVGAWGNGALAELQRGRDPDAAPAPIFVTGLPRSGTTLVEQILACHGSIVGGGEVELLLQCMREVGGRAAHEIPTRLRDSAELQPLAAYYRRLAAERFGEGVIVDKSLSTSRYAGLATTMLPDARFVWLVRHPRDCAWSAFRSHFAAGIPWANRLSDIGRHFAIEDRLRKFWANELGERMLVVSYADLVTEPRVTIPAIAAHCGLDLEPEMLEPHRKTRVVTTNSAAQVREPINQSAVGSSAAFADFLAPFEEAYRAG